MLKPKASPEELTNLYESLKIDAELSQNYVVLIVSSCLIASFGLIGNSAAVIIGAMIIAPLMLPLRSALRSSASLSLAFSALEGDLDLFRQSLISVGVGTGASILLAAFLGYLVGISEFGSEVLSRTQPNL